MNMLQKTIGVFLLSVMMFGCQSYVQVVDMTPIDSSMVDNGDTYGFDNDSVRLTYHFWGESGVYWFEILNELDVPIYIDWKRSNLINNNIPVPYWDSNINTESVAVGTRYGEAVLHSNGAVHSAQGSVVVSNSVTSAEERITFLPPKAVAFSKKYKLVSESYYVLPKDAEAVEETHDAKPSNTTIVYSQLLADNSPINITNFLTYSLSKGFDEDIFVSNSFEASRIREMELEHFSGKFIKYDGDVPIYHPKLSSPKRLFILLPKDHNHRSYWKLKN